MPHPRHVCNRVVSSNDLARDSVVVDLDYAGKEGVQSCVDSLGSGYASFKSFCGEVLCLDGVAERLDGSLEAIILQKSWASEGYGAMTPRFLLTW